MSLSQTRFGALAVKSWVTRPLLVDHGQQVIVDRRPGLAGDDAHLVNAVLAFHEDDPVPGSRFLTDELADLGIVASENRVWGLCSTVEASPLTPGRNPRP
jgi:hypothetical protein